MMRPLILATLGVLVAAAAAWTDEPPKPADSPAPTEYWTAGCSLGLFQPACGFPNLTLQADYLLWWIKNGPNPQPLVTLGTEESEGILGNPGTTVLYGGSGINFGPFSGGRITADWHADDCRTIQFSAFMLEQRSERFATASDDTGIPVITRPVFDIILGQETGSSVGFPNAFRGNVAVGSNSQLWGGELNLLQNWGCDDCRRVHLLLGFRYLELQEALYVHQDVTILEEGIAGFIGTPVFEPTRMWINDGFETQNRFYGAQIGGQTRIDLGSWSVDLVGKVAFGWTHQLLSLTGSTTALGQPEPIGVAPGGLLCLPSNIGRHDECVFAVVPEINITARYCIRENITARIGYTFLYWSDVVRPGEQVNRVVNAEQVPSSLAFGPLTAPAVPQPSLKSSDFWAMGLHFGLEIRY
ncbi:MAG: BBP7 family outer membrane beta-barrel protein [Gemmatales bacterium]|nr:BBP7 family outer membrane beta-barrel protein [Gemmatales bacterium]MDW8387528.1 BBP7 family outer membrane beta-barrel protein [Gemmatales bacterium]